MIISFYDDNILVVHPIIGNSKILQHSSPLNDRVHHIKQLELSHHVHVMRWIPLLALYIGECIVSKFNVYNGIQKPTCRHQIVIRVLETRIMSIIHILLVSHVMKSSLYTHE